MKLLTSVFENYQETKKLTNGRVKDIGSPAQVALTRGI